MEMSRLAVILQYPVRRMSGDDMRATRTFLASFLVLFLEVALIRWMPAYIRLLAYFSNFILLASFLGIGLGCLLAPARSRLFSWFPLLQAVVIAAVYYFRLEVAVPTSGSIYFSSGTAEKVVVVESTMLLPLLFVVVAALFATMAQRMGREMAALPPLRGYTINLAGQPRRRRRVRPDLVAGTSPGHVVRACLRVGACRCWSTDAPADSTQRGTVRGSAVPVVAVNVALLAGSLVLVHVMARGAIWSPVLQDHRRASRGRTRSWR